MKTNPAKVAHSAAFLGTILHTCVDYLAPLAQLPRVEVAELVGDKLAPSKSKRTQLMTGMLIHFVLGTVIFPAGYNLAARHLLPAKPLGTFTWAMILWLTGQFVVMPFCDKKGKFFRNPKRVFTYWLAHVAYSLPCSK